ncbi:LOW QUALITY PROTEIN: polyamine oxidase 1-like [Dioscorea cayenensis subsp. rotundata]|uniref:LOW QUALITY PROTEIN: polyamine oxidase 1-like n=1 Tax=Dioscorea cayennensis subsp. rotundata TaxID=55577 RepID=A0AB40ARM5_DIOCR|nr:LOW QUALITY PROTEIN: polyamine oxidase 1-like [Dioscorea cayenensis subsp. rotundata]
MKKEIMGRRVAIVVVSLVQSLLLLLLLSPTTTTATPTNPSVIIVGAGMSGIMAAKTLSDAGITNIQILEATDHIGGRMHKVSFAGINIEIGANWVEGVNGKEVNPIWTLANDLNLRNFFSDFDNVSSNCYKQGGGLHKSSVVEKAIETLDEVKGFGEKLGATLHPSGKDDISVLTMQRLMNHVPSDPVGMVVDYYTSDYEFAEPPRVTSMQNTVPLATFSNFGEDIYFVADQRGYGSVVEHLAHQFLKTDKKGNIVDPRFMLNKVVREISYSKSGVTVMTEDGKKYEADYVMVSVSIGVLQTHLIKFKPDLPHWKILALYQFDMAVYTKIFVKFPKTFWPTENGTEFFLYASKRRGYYPIWQQLEKQYPGANVLLVTVTDEESRRIEQQSNAATKAEIMNVLRDMFGKNIPEATDILVPRWWSDRFYKGTFSNWPIGVNRYEYDQIRAPVDRVYFTGEHTSESYNGYVHGAYLAGIDSANMMIKCIKKGMCKFHIPAKYT